MLNRDLHTQLLAYYEAQTLQIKVKAEETKLQSEQLVQESSLKLQTFNAEYLVYIEIINKLQSHQAKHLPAHSELLNYFLNAEVYQALHNEFLGKQFSVLFNALGSLADAMPANDSLLYAPLNQTLLNAILLTEDFVKYSKDSDADRNQPKVTALANAIEKAVIFAKNPVNEDNRLALSNATKEMMSNVAYGCISDRTRLFMGLGGALLLLTAAAMIVIALTVTMAPGMFILPLFMSSLPFIWGSVLSGFAVMGNSDRESLANNINKPLNKITKPGFFNTQQIAPSNATFELELQTSKRI